jgi:hypothetical protein
VQHCQVGVGPLLPAHEQTAEAVEPGLAALDHPAPGAEAGLVLERPRLLATRPHMGGEAELLDELVDLGEVVALVQTEALRMLLARVGPRDRDTGQGGAQELEVVDVRTCDLEPERDARALGEQAPLRPLLGSISGVAPAAFAAEGGISSSPRRPPATPTRCP